MEKAAVPKRTEMKEKKMMSDWRMCIQRRWISALYLSCKLICHAMSSRRRNAVFSPTSERIVSEDIALVTCR